MGQVKGSLGLDSLFSKKRTEGLDPFGQAVLGDSVVIQITAAEMVFQGLGKALVKIGFHEDNDGLGLGQDFPGVVPEIRSSPALKAHS